MSKLTVRDLMTTELVTVPPFLVVLVLLTNRSQSET